MARHCPIRRADRFRQCSRRDDAIYPPTVLRCVRILQRSDLARADRCLCRGIGCRRIARAEVATRASVHPVGAGVDVVVEWDRLPFSILRRDQPGGKGVRRCICGTGDIAGGMGVRTA